MRSVWRLVGGVLAAALAVGVLIPVGSSQQRAGKPNRAIERSLEVVTGRGVIKQHERLISGGVIQAALDANEDVQGNQSRGNVQFPRRGRTLGCSNVFRGRFDNVRVNQDCSFRRQAEEFIAIDPNDDDHLIAGQNDSRVGFNHCGIDFSFNRGKTWGDMLPPFWQFLLADGHTADAASDPALAFDSQSNAYFTCILFDVTSPANAIVVVKSDAEFGGTFFHSPAPVAFQHFRTNPPGVVVNETNPNIFHDKEFLAADTTPTSPKRDNVYVTWTRFRSECGPTGDDYCESPIFFSQSANGGATWSAPLEISGRSSAFCVDGNFFDSNLAPEKCNFDQGSWPLVGPDGTLYVFFNNENTPSVAHQQMMVKCLETADCSMAGNWTAPVRVADDFATQPFCTPIRQCLPPNTYRLNDFGAAGIERSTGRLYFAWSDFRNATAADHNNDVFLVFSDNGGATWSAPKLVSGGAGTKAAQWQAWMAVGPEGTVYVAYYDRQYGACENTGCNDITLAFSRDRGRTFQRERITTDSMPNLTAANNPIQAGFLGDYMSVAADAHGAVIVWADTRPHAGTVPEEDIYFADFPRP